MSVHAHYIDAAEAASAAAERAGAAWAAIKPRRLGEALTDNQQRLSAQARIASAMEKAAWTEAARLIADDAQEPSRVLQAALSRKAVPDALNNDLMTVEVAKAIAHGEAWAAQRIADYWVGSKEIAELQDRPTERGG